MSRLSFSSAVRFGLIAFALGQVSAPAHAADEPFVVLHSTKIYANTYIDDGHFDDEDRLFIVPSPTQTVQTSSSLFQQSAVGPFSSSAVIADDGETQFVEQVSYSSTTSTRSSSLPGSQTAYVEGTVEDFLAEIFQLDGEGNATPFIRISALKLSGRADIEGNGYISGTHSAHVTDLLLSGSFFGGQIYQFSGNAGPNMNIFNADGLSVTLNWSLPPGPPSQTVGGESYLPLRVDFDRLQVGGREIYGAIYAGGNSVSYFNYGAVPEPATWAMLILGFGAVGAMVRQQRVGTRTKKLA